MRITHPLSPRARSRETVLPMINVVFLLLIFFLMAAQIEPAAPFPVTPPETVQSGDAGPLERLLWVSAEGALSHDGREDEAALAALAALPGRVTIRADAALPAAELARLLQRLGALGIDEIHLIALSQPEVRP